MGARLDVERAPDGDGAHADHHLARRGDRIRPLAQLEDLRPTVAADDDRPHDAPLPMATREVYRVRAAWRSRSSPRSRPATGPASAVVRDGLVHRIPGAPGVRAMLDDWERWLDRARRRQLDDGVPLARVHAAAADRPIRRTSTWSAPTTPTTRARWPGWAPTIRSRRSPSGPFFFLKPTTTLIGDGAPVLIGEGVDAARLGGRARGGDRPPRRPRLARPAALDHVAGYTIVNDVSARDRFVRDGAPPAVHLRLARPEGLRGERCPCGPWLLPARDCPDPGRLALRLSVNGELMQDSSTARDALLARGADRVPLADPAAGPRRRHLDRHLRRRRRRARALPRARRRDARRDRVDRRARSTPSRRR